MASSVWLWVRKLGEAGFSDPQPLLPLGMGSLRPAQPRVWSGSLPLSLRHHRDRGRAAQRCRGDCGVAALSDRSSVRPVSLRVWEFGAPQGPLAGGSRRRHGPAEPSSTVAIDWDLLAGKPGFLSCSFSDVSLRGTHGCTGLRLGCGPQLGGGKGRKP